MTNWKQFSVSLLCDRLGLTGSESCAFLNSTEVSGTECGRSFHWICSKPFAPWGALFAYRLPTHHGTQGSWCGWMLLCGQTFAVRTSWRNRVWLWKLSSKQDCGPRAGKCRTVRTAGRPRWDLNSSQADDGHSCPRLRRMTLNLSNALYTFSNSK